jgi:hypothetical protein
MTTVTGTHQVPVYEDVVKQVPYEEPVEEILDPIVPGDNLVVAFVRFAGADTPTAEMISERIKLGFSQESSNSENIVQRISFVPRASLLRKLTTTQLQDMGPSVEKILRQDFKANIVCTGTVLSSSPAKLSIEVVDYRDSNVYSDVFEADSWQIVGAEVAKAFFGTRTRISTVTKYKSETTQKKVGTREEEYSYEDIDIFGTALAILLALGLIAALQ